MTATGEWEMPSPGCSNTLQDGALKHPEGGKALGWHFLGKPLLNSSGILRLGFLAHVSSGKLPGLGLGSKSHGWLS